MSRASSRVEAKLQEIAERVNAEVSRLVQRKKGIPQSLREAMLYPLEAGGKRLRSALVFASCRLVGGTDETAMPGAVAVELMHSYSLVHDDLPCMDDDDLRRGRPTLHKVYGEAMAVLVGDALQALAFEVLLSKTAGAGTQLEAARVLARAAGGSGMVGGQVLDLEACGQSPQLDLVREIHLMKTAALICASVEIGAILGAACVADCAILRRYGRKLGLAFQIVDDCLDRSASAVELGKSPGKDKEAGKMTWPACIGLEASKTEAGRLIQEAGSALKSLKTMDLGTDILEDLAAFVVERRL